MEPERGEYKGHSIELRARAETGPRADLAEPREEGLELLIDDEPVDFGQLPDGSYFLHDYAYYWTDNPMALARSFIDYRDRAAEKQREAVDRRREAAERRREAESREED
jgi:hypothetical protein